jgi:hypothetical protein
MEEERQESPSARKYTLRCLDRLHGLPALSQMYNILSETDTDYARALLEATMRSALLTDFSSQVRALARMSQPDERQIAPVYKFARDLGAELQRILPRPAAGPPFRVELFGSIPLQLCSKRSDADLSIFDPNFEDGYRNPALDGPLPAYYNMRQLRRQLSPWFNARGVVDARVVPASTPIIKLLFRDGVQMDIKWVSAISAA